MTEPGWYKDPHNAQQLRFFDGAQWLDFTKPALPAPRQAAPPPEQPLREHSSAERTAGGSALTVAAAGAGMQLVDDIESTPHGTLHQSESGPVQALGSRSSAQLSSSAVHASRLGFRAAVGAVLVAVAGAFMFGDISGVLGSSGDEVTADPAGVSSEFLDGIAAECQRYAPSVAAAVERTIAATSEASTIVSASDPVAVGKELADATASTDSIWRDVFSAASDDPSFVVAQADTQLTLGSLDRRSALIAGLADAAASGDAAATQVQALSLLTTGITTANVAASRIAATEGCGAVASAFDRYVTAVRAL